MSPRAAQWRGEIVCGCPRRIVFLARKVGAMSSQFTDHRRQDASIDTGELTERINEALEPAIAEISDRIAETVRQNLEESSRLSTADSAISRARGPSTETDRGRSTGESGKNGTETDTPEDTRQRSGQEPGQRAGSRTARRDGADEKRGSSGGDTDEESDGQSLFKQASGTLLSSFVASLRDEGGEQFESFIDTSVDMLFAPRAKGWVRNLADQTLQAVLYDALDSIDDPNERYELYRDSLSRLRPIVRQAVDAMYTEDTQRTLRRKLRAAIPSVLHGDFHDAFSKVVHAFSDITDLAEEEVWNHSTEVLQVVQQMSTTLLQENIEDSVNGKVDPEEIQEKVQGKANEVREKLAEKVGALQEGIQGAQSRLGGGSESSSRRGQTGVPPTGTPPSGVPPSGQPPSGRPPTGRPPHGFPPSGLPPAVQRQREAAQSRRG